MLTSNNLSSIFVNDQDEALAFYVGLLGLEVSADVQFGPMRWLTVRVPGEKHDILLERPVPGTAVLTQPGQPDHELHLPRRTLRECLAEELRRLDADVLYGRVITEGWERLGPADKGA